jgi:hypothetical protein
VRAFTSLLTSVPTASDPPGREVAVVLSQLLLDAGQHHTGPEQRRGGAWRLEAERAGARLECVLTLGDAGSGRWLLGSSLHRRGLASLAPGVRPEQEQALRAWCQALQAVLRADGRFTEVRWKAPEGWAL